MDNLEKLAIHQPGRNAFSNLPYEILCTILDLLTPGEPRYHIQSPPFRNHLANPHRIEHVDSRNALANLCRASSQFRSWATSHLYRNILLETPEQLASFFYSLTRNIQYRSLVRTFAWYDRDRRRSALYRHVMVRSMEPTDGKANGWPLSPTDKVISRVMRITESSTVPGWRILGALLGMIPEVRVLFYTLGTSLIAPDSYQSPEEQALLTLLGRPTTKKFLQNLQTVVLGPGRLAWRKWTWSPLFNSLLTLLDNSDSSLDHIELSHFPRDTGRDISSLRGGGSIQSHVKEFSLLEVSFPNRMMGRAVSMFPELTKLVVECREDNRYCPLSDFQAFGDLLQLSTTLETLSLTSVSSWRTMSYPIPRSTFRIPPLLLVLRQMGCLRNLTTESIWLFGIDNHTVDPCLTKSLPASLECLRLLDFWGVTSGFPYYPNTLTSWNGLWFYDQAFSELQDSHMTQGSNLKDITIALYPDITDYNTVVAQVVPPMFDRYGRSVPGDIPSFIEKHQRLFSEVGARFTNVTPNQFKVSVKLDRTVYGGAPAVVAE